MYRADTNLVWTDLIPYLFGQWIHPQHHQLLKGKIGIMFLRAQWWVQACVRKKYNKRKTPNHSSQREASSKKWEVAQWENEVLRCTPGLQNNGFIVLHKADGCWQQCNRTTAKESVDQAHELKGRYVLSTYATPGTLGTHRRRCYSGRRGREMAQRSYAI